MTSGGTNGSVAHTAYPLNDGTTLPRVGFGTWPLRGEEGIAAIVGALDNGYRLLDTAVNYDNEADVSEAVRRSDVPREQVALQTKVPGRCHDYDLAVRSVEDSLRALGVDRLDVVLIHWPNPRRDLYVRAWEALIACRERGLVRTIGVSNFGTAHLERLVAQTGVTPAVNQIELHPVFPQPEMRATDERLGIRTQAWSPLGKTVAPLDAEPVVAAARAHGVSPGRAILRWHLQLGTLPIPKSADPQRQRDNLRLDGFTLTDAEVAAISSLARADGRRFGGDPDTHEEM